jgi:UDP-N-acetylglucosamine acyltransferase
LSTAFDSVRTPIVLIERLLVRTDRRSEGVTVHRGTDPGSKTKVGARCLLMMSNSHFPHNCELGEDVTIVSGALLAAYVRVGPRAMTSGSAAMHQFVRIGKLVMVSGPGEGRSG